MVLAKSLLLTCLTAASALSNETNSQEPQQSFPLCDGNTFDLSKTAGVEIQSVTAKDQKNYTTVSNMPDHQPRGVLDFCRVKISYNLVEYEDIIQLEVWLPSDRRDWNGRYQATGGRGLLSGVFDDTLGPALSSGYAASSTDGGHSGDDMHDLSWALKADGTVDLVLLQTASTWSLAKQVIISKRVVEQFYGKKPHHSYWNGCSQGGRQGYVMAQQYPHLLDGILANAPGIGLAQVGMGNFWPQLVMKEEGYHMSDCEFNFFHQKAMEECDMLDGASDGIISDPDVCDFDPLHIIGQTYYCNGKESQVTVAMTEIIRKIEQGPTTPLKKPIWHGYPLGTSMQDIADGASSAIINTLLLNDPSFNVTKLSYTTYMALWAQASYNYGWILDASNPNLDALQASGTKLLTWHGINDNIIPYMNTVRYRERVELVMGGAAQVDEFYRLFLAPGVSHCTGGAGPVPVDPLAALVDWVENGEPPESLEASTVNKEGDLMTRDLCAWPGKAKYMGLADPKRASSWSCMGGTEREFENPLGENYKEPGRAGDILDGLKNRLEGLGMGLRIG